MSIGPNRRLVLPDLAAFRNGRSVHVECKAKTSPRYMIVRKSLVHCFDLRLYREYLQFQSSQGAELIIGIFEANDTREAERNGDSAGIKLLPGTTLYESLSLLQVRHGTPGHERHYQGEPQVFFLRDSLRTLEAVIGRSDSPPCIQTDMFA